MIIDASKLVLGRLASYAAKKALQGEEIIIVNAEKAVVSGKKENTITLYKEKTDRGHALKGPYFPKTPDRIVRRTIRGMLPYKQEKGRKAFERVMCYINIPEKLQGQKFETVPGINAVNLKKLNYISIEALSKQLKK